jgi:DNA-binding GntR family transcriptional regulator
VPRGVAHTMNTHKTFVRQAILRAIASGRWQPGAPIPDENELASEFGVTVGVIRETLQALEREVVLVRAARSSQRHRAR